MVLEKLRVSSRSHNATALLCMGAALFLNTSLGCSDPDFVEAVLEASPEIWKKNSDRFSAPIHWTSCPEGFAGECAKLQVPVDWLNLSSDSLEVMIARRKAKDPLRAKGSLWLIDGGPGLNGQGFAQKLDAAWPSILDRYNVYTLVHRGTFHSQRLSCPRAESKDSPGRSAILPNEAASCVADLNAQWGDDLENFRTTHAARDLSHAIRRTRRRGERVFLYAFSYGSLLAQRFAQIAPHQATGIILDGVLPPQGVSYFDFDAQHNHVGQAIAHACAMDSFCSEKWGPNPWERMSRLKEKLKDGHCPSLGMKPSQLSKLTGDMIASRQSREDALAILYRVDRCHEEDVKAVQHYFKTIKELGSKGAGAWDPRRFSTALFYNIIFSESTGGGQLAVPSLKDLSTICENAVFCPTLSEMARRVYDHWPQYKADRFFGTQTNFRVPVLAMSGGLDPKTPIETARSIASKFEGVSQTFIEFPLAPHGLWANSAVKEKGKLNCAGQLVAQFLGAPGQKLNTACAADLVGLNFKGDPKRNAKLFGKKSAWENESEQGAPF